MNRGVVETFDPRTGQGIGYVTEQTLEGYGLRVFTRSPFDSFWQFARFVHGFGSRAEAREYVEREVLTIRREHFERELETMRKGNA